MLNSRRHALNLLKSTVAEASEKQNKQRQIAQTLLKGGLKRYFTQSDSRKSLLKQATQGRSNSIVPGENQVGLAMSERTPSIVSKSSNEPYESDVSDIKQVYQ